MKIAKTLLFPILLLSLLNFSLQACAIQSLTMQVENLSLEGKYNLYLNLGSPDKCSYKCVFSPDVGQGKDMGPATPNKSNPMTFYKYKFSNLEDYKEYTFTCASGDYTSDKYTIKFPRNPDTVKLLAFGDWGDAVGTKASQSYGPVTLEYVKTRKDDDAILFAGDLAYDLHNLIRTDVIDNGKNGDSWLNKITPVTSRVPFQMIWGNHEAMEKDRKFPNYFGRFSFPEQTGAKEGNGNWYSFNVGKNVHILAINNNILADQYANGAFVALKDKLQAWMTQDLANNKRRWTILYLHNPLYCNYPQEGGDGRCKGAAQDVRKFLEETVGIVGKVDLVVTGHVHNYERYHPMSKGAQVGDAPADNVYNNPKAPINVVCGHAGQSEGVGSAYDVAKVGGVKVSGNPGVCEIVITGNKLTFNMIAGNRDKPTPAYTVQDTFVINKSNNLKRKRNH